MTTNRIGVSKTGPYTSFYLDADVIQVDAPNNRSLIRANLRNVNSGDGTSRFLNWGGQYGYFNGWEFGKHEAQPFLPQVAGGTTRWNDQWEFWVAHDGNGYYNGNANVQLQMSLSYGSVNEPHYGAIHVGRIPKAPNKPTGLKIRAGTVGTNSFGVEYNRGGTNGAAITADQAEWSTAAGTIVWTDGNGNAGSGPAGYTSPNGGTTPGAPALLPGTTYYVRVRSKAGDYGWSAWSDSISQTTLPSVPPGMSVTPDSSGVSATVALTPPGGVTGVNSYTIERRPVGSTSAVATSGASTTQVVAGLTPGTSYEWRSRARIGTYDSPWTGWVTAYQPDPGATPGAYFDGSSPAKPNATYSWVGTTGKSRSVATGAVPEGWLSFTEGKRGGAVGDGVVYRAIGGLFSSYSARVSIRSHVTATAGSPLLTMGVGAGGAAEVVGDGVYWASIWLLVGPGALVPAQIRPGIDWYNGSTYLSTDLGDVESYASTAEHNSWRRFSIQRPVPAGATHGAPVVVAVNESGFSLRSGMTLALDGAMMSITPADFFDGDSPDTLGYQHAWTGEPEASPSVRRSVPFSVADLLMDPDCPPPPQPPRPPAVPADCIAEIDTWRRYSLQVSADQIRAIFDMVPTLTLSTGSAAERQVRIRAYPNPDGLSPALLDVDSWESEQILSYIPPNTSMVIDGVAQQVWASVDGSVEVNANHLLYGTDGTPATWPVLSCGYGYVITLDTPADSPVGNLSASLQLTRRF